VLSACASSSLPPLSRPRVRRLSASLTRSASSDTSLACASVRRPPLPPAGLASGCGGSDSSRLREGLFALRSRRLLHLPSSVVLRLPRASNQSSRSLRHRPSACAFGLRRLPLATGLRLALLRAFHVALTRSAVCSSVGSVPLPVASSALRGFRVVRLWLLATRRSLLRFRFRFRVRFRSEDCCELLPK